MQWGNCIVSIGVNQPRLFWRGNSLLHNMNTKNKVDFVVKLGPYLGLTQVDREQICHAFSLIERKGYVSFEEITHLNQFIPGALRTTAEVLKVNANNLFFTLKNDKVPSGDFVEQFINRIYSLYNIK